MVYDTIVSQILLFIEICAIRSRKITTNEFVEKKLLLNVQWNYVPDNTCKVKCFLNKKDEFIVTKLSLEKKRH